MSTVLVCGGRNYGLTWDESTLQWLINEPARAFLRSTLTDLHAQRAFTLLIHGAARGADTLAEFWAITHRVRPQAYAADWKRLGRSAGPRRNEHMLVDGKPMLVVAFKGDNGTKNMIDIARRAGVEVITPGWEYMEKLIP